MTGYDAYTVFNSVRLHFTTNGFDYFRYNGKSKVSLEAFEEKKEKYLFHKLARIYKEDELPYFFAVNFLKNEKFWTNMILQEESANNYKEWIKWQQARTHKFKEDLQKLSEMNFGELIICKDGQFPELLNLVLQNEIAYDSFTILDHFIKLADAWNKKLEGDFIWDSFYKKFSKYKSFFVAYAPLSDPHYKKLLKENLTLR